MNTHHEHPADNGRGCTSPIGGVSNPAQSDLSKREEMREGPHPMTGREPAEGPRKTY